MSMTRGCEDILPRIDRMCMNGMGANDAYGPYVILESVPKRMTAQNWLKIPYNQLLQI